jgi:hypothetical protein
MEDDVKSDHTEISCENVNWVELADDSDDTLGFVASDLRSSG